MASIVSLEKSIVSLLCLFSLPAFKIVSLLFALQHTVNVPGRGEKKSGGWVGRGASVTSDPSYRPREALRDSHHIPGGPRMVAPRT